MGYNPITHQYEESNRGQQLRNQDENKEVNRYVRAKNISDRNSAKFNIITGEDSHHTKQVPSKLQGRVEAKYQ